MWVRSWLSKWLPSPSQVHVHPDYRRAYEFKNDFVPDEGSDYNWVGAYAREIYARLSDADQALDTKAESIIKILGGGTGLLTLGAVINLQRIGLWVGWCLAVALVFALMAIVVAAWVRVPRQTFLPPSVAWATRYTESYGELGEARFLGQWHLTCEGMRLAVSRKAKGVRIATWCAVGSLAVVAISFIVALLTTSFSN